MILGWFGITKFMAGILHVHFRLTQAFCRLQLRGYGRGMFHPKWSESLGNLRPQISVARWLCILGVQERGLYWRVQQDYKYFTAVCSTWTSRTFLIRQGAKPIGTHMAAPRDLNHSPSDSSLELTSANAHVVHGPSGPPLHQRHWLWPQHSPWSEARHR